MAISQPLELRQIAQPPDKIARLRIAALPAKLLHFLAGRQARLSVLAVAASGDQPGQDAFPVRFGIGNRASAVW